jgi:hypothetical protein
MVRPETAAQDPIFWLHHANIDRLWERWLQLGGGRANPVNFSPWIRKGLALYSLPGRNKAITPLLMYRI